MKLGRRSRKVLVDLGAEGKRWVFQQVSSCIGNRFAEDGADRIGDIAAVL